MECLDLIILQNFLHGWQAGAYLPVLYMRKLVSLSFIHLGVQSYLCVRQSYIGGEILLIGQEI
jgi:hypothetical protein